MFTFGSLAPSDARSMACLFAALGEPTRMRLIHLLAERPQRTAEIAERLQLSVYILANHLHRLRESGLTTLERRGRNVYHRLNTNLFVPSHDHASHAGMIFVGAWQLFLARPAEARLTA